jgi:type I restriction enzyme R subunit
LRIFGVGVGVLVVTIVLDNISIFKLLDTQADKLLFDQIEQEMLEVDKIIFQAKNNTEENFKYGFDEIFSEKLIDRREQNEEIFTNIFNDKDFGEIVKSYIRKKVYQKLNKG